MPFGEYELSPGLIGLSLLHSAHPEAFQRLSVRTSIPCYRDFTLAKCRSPGFASAHADSTPYSGSLSLRMRASSRLSSPAKATRRLIMQKARRHAHKARSDRLRAHGFRICFNLLGGVLFTFPSRYWYAIGLAGVFSLAGWSRRIQAGLHVSRPTQDAARGRGTSATGLSPSAAPLSRRPRLVPLPPQARSYNPGDARRRPPVWAPPLSLATTRGIIGLFSLPAGTKMFQFPAFASPTERGIPAKPVGCPIRRPADQRPLAPTRGLSQLVTSFIASASQGIRHAPSNYFHATRPKGGRRSTCVLACADCQRSIAETNGGAGKGGGQAAPPGREPHGQKGETSPERRCSSRTFRYGYLVTT